MSNTPIFSKLFGPSPISPIQHHMGVCNDCAQEFALFFGALLDGNWEVAEKHAERVDQLEGEADDIKKKIRLSLPRSIFLPVSRGDLLEILQMQDRIPNTCKDVVGLTTGRRMAFPDRVSPIMRDFAGSCVAAVALAQSAMDELNDLIITGFSGQEIDFIEDILEKLHAAEHESDLRQVEVRARLFEQEQELDPVDVMFMYRVIDLIGDVADNAQTVGNRMMYLIAS